MDNWSGDTQMIVDWMSSLYPRGNINSFSNVNKDQYKHILESMPFDYSKNARSFTTIHRLARQIALQQRRAPEVIEPKSVLELIFAP